MKSTRIIVVLVCAAVLGLAGCGQQPPAQSGGEEIRPEAPATNAPAPSMSGEGQP